MIYVYIKRNEIFFYIDEEVYSFTYDDINNDIPDIIDQLVFQENEKVFMILDDDKQDAKIYILALKKFKLITKKLIYVQDIFVSLNKDILIIGDEISLKIENGKFEKIDIKKEDNFDLDGIEHIYINNETVSYIFELCKSRNIKNRLSLNYNIKYAPLVFCVITLIISYFLSSYLYNSKDIEHIISSKNNEINKIDIKIREIEKNIGTKEEEYNRLPDIEKFRSELGNKNIYNTLNKLINLVENSVNYSSIKFINNELIIEGICENYDVIETEFQPFKIEYLLNMEYGVKFKIAVKVVEDE